MEVARKRRKKLPVRVTPQSNRSCARIVYFGGLCAGSSTLRRTAKSPRGAEGIYTTNGITVKTCAPLPEKTTKKRENRVRFDSLAHHI